jgi:ribosomal protein L12E/L44/L45/RPP1/RPP2
VAKEQQTHLTNLTRSLQDLANGKVDDVELQRKLDRFLSEAVRDATDFADWMRVDALSFNLEFVPLVSRETLLTMMRMIAAHQNEAFERLVSRAKALVAAVGDASFSEAVPRDKPPPPVRGLVATAGGRQAAPAAVVESESTEESESSDDDDESAWGLCRFIRSFLFVPSRLRGEDDWGK